MSSKVTRDESIVKNLDPILYQMEPENNAIFYLRLIL